MNSFFFSGSHVAKLDDKGRFVLPQEMRYGLVENGKCEFTIGLGMGGSLAIYKKSVIDTIAKKFQEKQYAAKFQKFFTLFFSTLYHTECDKIGRVLLPSLLKNAAKIQKEIVVAGVMDKIELWPKEVYEQNLENLLKGATDFPLNRMMEDAFALLHEEEEKVSPKDAIQNVMKPFSAPHPVE